MKKIIQIVFFILAGSIPSLLAIRFLNISGVKFIGSEFLLGYLGVFLGFAFSIVTYVSTLIDKARTKIDTDDSYNDTERNDFKVRIMRLTEEVADNMKFLFFSFLFIVIIMILEVWDVPMYSLQKDLWYTKMNLLNAVKFSIFSWSVYAIYDLLIGTFSLNNRVDNILKRPSVPPNGQQTQELKRP